MQRVPPLHSPAHQASYRDSQAGNNISKAQHNREVTHHNAVLRALRFEAELPSVERQRLLELKLKLPKYTMILLKS